MAFTITFATTNEGKIKEASELLHTPVEGVGLAIDEIQSLDPIEVATKKAYAYYNELKRPILVEDVSLTFCAMGKLPGTYVNDFSKELGNEGLVKLIEGSSDRCAVAQTTLVYIDNEKQEHVFEGIVQGEISEKPLGENGFGWDAIFIPKGATLTFGQMSEREKNKYSMRAIAFKKFLVWIEAQK